MLQDATTYKTVYTIADALLRPLQTQTPSPNGGRILTDTRYDSRGLAYESYADIWDKDKGPEGVYARAEYGSTPSQTATVFDGLGRSPTHWDGPSRPGPIRGRRRTTSPMPAPCPVPRTPA
ncbi:MULTISPECIES: hypothetical protein [Streptomyces]|uniref:hypothetical protein n=1 Tax=Streptomyces TaxID=1883 RepID=UPI003686A804